MLDGNLLLNTDVKSDISFLVRRLDFAEGRNCQVPSFSIYRFKNFGFHNKIKKIICNFSCFSFTPP